MTPAQLFFFVILPLGIGAVGVLLGETFRAAQMRQAARLRNVAVHSKGHAASAATKTDFVELTPREWAFIFRNRQQDLQRDISSKYGDLTVAMLRKYTVRLLLPALMTWND